MLIGGLELAGRLAPSPCPVPGSEALSPIALVVPGQLVVEATARRRGVDPDSPVGLGKVTLTR